MTRVKGIIVDGARSVDVPEYDSVLTDVAGLLESARRASARSVNAIMTATYWQVGRRIVEYEQRGKARAAYGEALVDKLARDLTRRFGRGFGRRNLFQMKAFYLANPEIVQTPSAQSPRIPGRGKVQTPSAQSPAHPGVDAVRFPLPWSHYVRLLSVENVEARGFYETEALRGGWTVRQLDRQIGSQFYERTALSRNKAAMLEKGERRRPGDAVAPEEELKDPFVLEFLGLKDEYSESELEAALIARLESFLLELGGDFTFVGRQRRLRVGDSWFRIDLLCFHRRLRCLVIIDLKLDKLTPGDAGQMNLYVNYAREHWTLPGENPPVGLILCAGQDSAVAQYALGGMTNKILAAQYRTALPDEVLLAEELRRSRKLLEERRSVAGAPRTPGRKPRP
jgi:predicted nuclease of restriction endonuclease-like (RecB) superfamily